MNSWVETIGAVVAGGVLTTGGQLLLEWRRNVRARREQEAERRELTRQAARLVLLDALGMLSMLRSTQETERWLTDLRLPVSSWRQYGEHLAGVLDDQQFRDVGAAFTLALSLNEIVVAGGSALVFQRTVRVRANNGLGESRDEAISACSHAMRTLLPLALPTVDKSDELYRLVQSELQRAESASGEDAG